MATPEPQQLKRAESGCRPRGGAALSAGINEEIDVGPSRWLLWLPLLLVQGYRFGISPFLAPHCRHFPSCSEYTLEALRRHGLGRGLWLAGRRIARCGPNGGDWSYDPVPPATRAPARPSRPLPTKSR